MGCRRPEAYCGPGPELPDVRNFTITPASTAMAKVSMDPTVISSSSLNSKRLKHDRFTFPAQRNGYLRRKQSVLPAPPPVV